MKFNIKESIKKRLAGEASTPPQNRPSTREETVFQKQYVQSRPEISKSKKSNQVKPTPFSKIEFRGGDSWVCHGCRILEQTLFTKENLGSTTKETIFHEDFKELVECMKGAHGCRSCRIFHRAFLLRQPSVSDEQRLMDETKPVIASIFKVDSLRIEISLGPVNEDEHMHAYVACMDSPRGIEYQRLEYDPTVTATSTVKQWLNICENDHKCKHLAWSRANPTRLLRIIDETTFLLEDCRDLPFRRYVALSYCWGGSVASPEENKIITAAQTVRSNLERRKTQAESTDKLPATIRDAIAFTKRIGIDYLWIDSLCIIQDDKDDWNNEAPTMHIVYCNSIFTLCASANNKATEAIFRDREAWRYKSMPCKMGGFHLVNLNEGLYDSVRASPLAKRGWTLQEDVLSPRKLYWFNQVLYWSCHESALIEGDNERNRRPIHYGHFDSSSSSTSLGFLAACRNGTNQDRRIEWYEIVRLYSRRDLSFADDKFKAISSVAIQYLSSQVVDRGHVSDIYLAGQWYRNFAVELAWMMETVSDQQKVGWEKVQDIAPSWSWASLPGVSPLIINDRTPATDFELSMEGLPGSKFNGEVKSADAVVQDGQKKFKIRITGRFRLFTAENSKAVPWKRVANPKWAGIAYDATDFIGTDVHFVDPDTGAIVSVEARRPACEGQLDYVQDARRIESGVLETIYCLEICMDAMLLLEKVDQAKGVYRRLGVCCVYWEGFFAQAERIDIVVQ